MDDVDDEGVEFDIDVPVKKRTDLSLLIEIEGEDYWVPHSQIMADSEVTDEGDTGTLLVTTWWAEKVELA